MRSLRALNYAFLALHHVRVLHKTTVPQASCVIQEPALGELATSIGDHSPKHCDFWSRLSLCRTTDLQTLLHSPTGICPFGIVPIHQWSCRKATTQYKRGDTRQVNSDTPL